ncbi:hypothetical protein GCM10023210_35430 [Chryseobacterium ginsengisoli]|uniref:Uncharacterized protein n=1 Tax=Chryseobacterium ginsengisoli TaxID=363853 RepID=A0ABP9MT99_9FLAO
MKKFTLLAGALILVSATVSAQVGVNTSTPKTTMDVSAKRDTGGNIIDNTQIFGLQAPRLTRAELTTNTATYAADQSGALIYITDISGGNTSGQRVNINAVGYYFFNGNLWQKVVSDNIYNANGLLTNARTLDTNGFNLTFTGTKMKTYWDSDGTLMQQGLASSPSKYANMILFAPDNNSNGINSRLDFQIYPESYAQIIAGDDATGLALSTNQTTISAPITFSTNTGANALATEKMRITGEGNVGITTTNPQVTLDVAGTPATATILDGIRAPRLTGSQMRAKTYTTSQLAAIVYATAADTAPAGQTINVTSAGYYYFDGTAWQRMKVNDVNIYNNNGALTSGRTLSNNGFSLTFTGTSQSSIWDSSGGFNQRGFASGKRSSIIIASDDNNSDGANSSLQLFQDPESVSQIIATSDSRGFYLGTSYTTTSTPLVFTTSAGSSAVGTERMRITGEGNVAINTSPPTERLDVNGNTRLRVLPLNGTSNAIYTQSGGTASATQNQTFTATRTVVADANGVLGYVTGLPQTAGSGSGTINIGETVSRVYSLPAATANTSTFNLKTYVTANSLQALPQLDGLEMNLQGVNSTYYDPRVYNIATGTQLVSYQTFATQVNENETSLNNSLTSGSFVQVDANNIVFWTNSNAEVITTNLQVQVDATTYRWYEFKWWCMEVGTEKKIFLSVTRKG